MGFLAKETRRLDKVDGIFSPWRNATCNVVEQVQHAIGPLLINSKESTSPSDSFTRHGQGRGVAFSLLCCFSVDHAPPGHLFEPSGEWVTTVGRHSSSLSPFSGFCVSSHRGKVLTRSQRMAVTSQRERSRSRPTRVVFSRGIGIFERTFRRQAPVCIFRLER